MELAPIEDKIHYLSGERIMLDYDLAELFALSTKVVNFLMQKEMNQEERNLIGFKKPPKS